MKEHDPFLELSRGNYRTKKPLNELEMDVLDIILERSQFDKGQAVSNRDIARELDIPRKLVKQARMSLAEKIDIIPKGF